MTISARRASGARNETLQSAAQRLYDDAGRNSKSAVASLLLEIRRRPALHEEAFKIAAETMVGNLDRTDRARIMSGRDTGSVVVPDDAQTGTVVEFTPQSAASKAASSARLRAFSVKLTGLYLAKFKDGNGGEFLLGQATPDQLRASASHYMGQGATMVRTARWLEKIIASAKEGEPIHRSLKLKEIERMQREAFDSDV